jgi:hypothetical protein
VSLSPQSLSGQRVEKKKNSNFRQEPKPRILECPPRSSCVRTHKKILTLEHHGSTLFSCVWPNKIVTCLVGQKAEWTTNAKLIILVKASVWRNAIGTNITLIISRRLHKIHRTVHANANELKTVCS